jgi:hypothetical protein
LSYLLNLLFDFSYRGVLIEKAHIHTTESRVPVAPAWLASSTPAASRPSVRLSSPIAGVRARLYDDPLSFFLPPQTTVNAEDDRFNPPQKTSNAPVHTVSLFGISSITASLSFLHSSNSGTSGKSSLANPLAGKPIPGRENLVRPADTLRSNVVGRDPLSDLPSDPPHELNGWKDTRYAVRTRLCDIADRLDAITSAPAAGVLDVKELSAEIRYLACMLDTSHT